MPAATRLRELGAEVFVWDDNAASCDAAEGFTVKRPAKICAWLVAPKLALS